MMPRSKISSTLSFACLLGLNACFGGGTNYSYQNVTVTVTPQIASLGVNATQVFTASATNAPDNPIWSVQNDYALPHFAGTLTGPSTTSPTVTYTAPATPPIYTPAAVAAGAVQGSVTVVANVLNNPKNFFSSTAGTVTFVITAPSITVAVSPATASVGLGKTQQFSGYAVGAVNNAVSWEVNGVAGGSVATGTISATGLYTAPANQPMAGPTVTVTIRSQGDATKSASAVVTLI